jgi:hypothetical protein
VDKKAQWALVGAAWFLALTMAGLAWMLWRHFVPAAQPPVWSVAADGTARCPVTGKRVPAVPETPHVDYLGHIYYFAPDKDAEGNDARTRFLMDPERWLAASHP